MHPRLNALLVALALFGLSAVHAVAENATEIGLGHAITSVLPASAASAAGVAAMPQEAASQRYPLDVAFTFNPTLSNSITSKSFFMMGGSVQIHGQFYRNWGVVADVAGLDASNINSAGADLGMITTTFGPRYTWNPTGHKYSLYAQGLVGLANAFSGIFPATSGTLTSQTSLATIAGGGMNLAITPRISLRVFELDWLRTQLPNSTTNVQNNLRIGTGVALHFR